MQLNSAVRLKKESKNFKAKFNTIGLDWVYSNELEHIDRTIPAGSWCALQDSNGKTIAYGHFNPYSLIAFRVFQRSKFVSEEETRALFFKRLDDAWVTRQRAYSNAIHSGEMGRFSFRLCFGESDGLPGLVCDLFESGSGEGFAVIQCHSAGADHFISWTQSWLSERMGIESGVVRNDIEVRKKENAKLEKFEWGDTLRDTYVFEGGVRFFTDVFEGQKTGYFYDLRDSRSEFSKRVASIQSYSTAKSEVSILDCFSYIGSWGLQALRKNENTRLMAVDVSSAALERLKRNAEENRLSDRIEYVTADFFKDKELLSRLAKQNGSKFQAVIMDPPSLTSSAKQAREGARQHEFCFSQALSVLQRANESAINQSGIVALAACSYHLKWDDFLGCAQNAARSNGGVLKFSHFGSQSADHPILSNLHESRYLKCVIGEWIR